MRPTSTCGCSAAIARSSGVQGTVFLATTAQGLVELLPTLAPLIGPDTVIIPLVNGVPGWYFLGSGGSFDGEVVTTVDPRGTLRAGPPGNASSAALCTAPHR